MTRINSVPNSRFATRSMGKSLAFNGSSDSATLPASVVPSTTGFNASFLVCIRAFSSSANQMIFNACDAAFTNGFAVYIPQSQNYVVFQGGAASTNFTLTSPVLNLNQWYVVTITFETNNAKLYLNNTLIATDTACSLATVTQTLTLGKRSNAANQYFNGFVDELVFDNGAAWSADIIDSISMKGVIPSSITPDVYYKFNDNTDDSSGNANTLTLSGTSYSANVASSTRLAATNRFLLAGSAQKSLTLNGSSDLATIPITPDITGFSAGFWMNSSRLTTNNKSMLNYQTAAAQDGFTIRNATPNTFQVLVYNNSTLEANITSNFFTKGWHYITLTFKVNEASLYVDGVLQASKDTSCAMTAPTAQTLTLGRLSFNNSGHIGADYYRLTFQNSTTPWTLAQIVDLFYRNVIPTGASQYTLNNVATDTNGLNALTLTGTTYTSNAPTQSRSSV